MALQPYRAGSGRVRVFDTDACAVLPESDPRCARFATMTDAELQLAGGYRSTPVTAADDSHGPISIDLPIELSSRRSKTTSSIIHSPAPKAPATMTKQEQIARIVLAMTSEERHQCRMLNVAPEEWAERRLEEVTSGEPNVAVGSRSK